MAQSRLLQSLTVFVERIRPSLFSSREWWFFLLLFPPLFPLGAYMYMGVRYFQDIRTFAVGTPIGFFIYWMSMTLYVLSGRWIIHRFPEQRQAGQRIVTMMLIWGSMVAVMAVLDVWLFSIVPGTGTQFSIETITPVWIFGGFFVIVLCLAISLFYIYSQWQDRQTENEELKREALQQQYDTLKGQVTPHFLFNSLSSISALIGEDNAQAERFVDNLAKVYRYMLQAGKQPLTLLTDELNFIRIYTELLRIRYGESLRIDIPETPADSLDTLPPLSLQTLIDNALKHNTMAAIRPLFIEVTLVEGRGIRVTNTLQCKTRIFDTTPHGLANLTAKYQQLSNQPVQVKMDDERFSVLLPLL